MNNTKDEKMNAPILPMEIVDMILDMRQDLLNRDTHRQNMESIRKQIQVCGLCNQLKELPPFQWMTYFSRGTANKYMEILSNCKCCNEHQINRPTISLFKGSGAK